MNANPSELSGGFFCLMRIRSNTTFGGILYANRNETCKL